MTHTELMDSISWETIESYAKANGYNEQKNEHHLGVLAHEKGRLICIDKPENFKTWRPPGKFDCICTLAELKGCHTFFIIRDLLDIQNPPEKKFVIIFPNGRKMYGNWSSEDEALKDHFNFNKWVPGVEQENILNYYKKQGYRTVQVEIREVQNGK